MATIAAVIRGADLKWGKNLHPADGEGRVGAAGFNKANTLEMMKAIAHGMPGKPNIIVKAGKNAKWYIKTCPPDEILAEIEKLRNSARGGNMHRATLYVLSY
jgi:hypothetical protein